MSDKIMSDKIKKGDFVEIKYQAYIEGQLFDTTDPKEASKIGLVRANLPWGAVRICVGDGHVLKGLDSCLEGKEVGKDYEIKLKPEEAFGKKSTGLIKMVPRLKFTKSNVNPSPGQAVNIDGIMARILTVSGGRILVDFNHPLADKEVEYKFKVVRKLIDEKEIIESLIALNLDLLPEKYELKIEGKFAKIKFKDKFEFDKTELSFAIKEKTKLDVSFD